MIKKILTTLLIFGFVGSAFGADVVTIPGYYKSGNHTNCDDVSGWAVGDVQAAIDASGASDTIHVCAGTYDSDPDLDSDGDLKLMQDGQTLEGDGDTTIFNMTASGHYIGTRDQDDFTFKDFKITAGKTCLYPLRVYSGPTDSGLIDSVTVDNADWGIWIRGGSGTVVQDCTITGDNDQARGVAIHTDATYPLTDDVTVKRCTFSGIQRGVSTHVTNLDGTEEITNVLLGGSLADRNTYTNIGEFGIHITGHTTGYEIAYEYINGVTGMDWGRGIELYSTSATHEVTDGDIHHCQVLNITDPTGGGIDGAGIGADDNTDDILIRNNYVYNAKKGLATYKGTNITFFNNIVENSGDASGDGTRAGIRFGDQCSGSIVHNTVIGGTGTGIYLDDGASDPVIKNNLVNSSGGLLYGIRCESASGCNSYDWDFNNVVAETSDFQNMAAGSNTVTVDPQLTGYRPQNVLVYDGGTDLGYTSDYSRTPYGAYTPIGAMGKTAGIYIQNTGTSVTIN